MTDEPIILGIDLGTTHSAMARVDSEGHVEMIPNSDGDLTTPSVIFVEGDTVIVGKEAAKAALLDPDCSAECFKRDMGRPHYHKKVCGAFMRPEVLSSMLLRKLKNDAEAKLGKIAGAVITVPAFFDDTRRKATQDAGKIAGLKVYGVLNEPIAAAIHYGFSVSKDLALERERHVLVYDLGGGTFDATLMRITPDGELITMATDGDIMLGGKDWDQRLVEHVASEYMRTAGTDPREDDLAFQDLVLRVEEAKKTLSKRNTAHVDVTCGGQRLRVAIEKQLFEDLTADLLTRTQTTIELLLADANMPWEQVDNVLTVGGSSRMPMVAEMLKRVTGNTANTCLDPDLAIARGAAIYAASQYLRKHPGVSPQTPATLKLKRLRLRNVNSHSLGVEAVNETNGNAENAIIIPRNTPVPCEKKEVFYTAETSSEQSGSISIGILEGEAQDPQACVPIGKCVIDGLPSGLQEGSPVEVVFSYSEEGRIHVRATATEANRSAAAEIFRPNALKEEELESQMQFVSELNIV